MLPLSIRALFYEIRRCGAARLGRRDEVEHGLAIATHIFPELKSWAHPEKWAVPLAARRVVLVNYE